MIQSKTLISVLIMSTLTAACSGGGGGGNGGNRNASRPFGAGAGTGGSLILADSDHTIGNNGTQNSNSNTKTVGMYESTQSAAALPSANNGAAVGDPLVENLDMSRPLTPTSYSPSYQDAVNTDQAQPPQQSQQQPAQSAWSSSSQSNSNNNAYNAPMAAQSTAPIAYVNPNTGAADASVAPIADADTQVTPSLAPLAPVDTSAQPQAQNAPVAPNIQLAAQGDDRWTPGLPPGHEPVAQNDIAHQMSTDPSFPGEQFSDSKEDFLMAHFIAKLNTDTLISADRVFAKQIVAAYVTRVKDIFSAKIQIIEDGEATPKKVTLQGTLNDPANKSKHRYQSFNERKALLQSPVDKKSNYHYLAHLTCWDQNLSTCNTSVMEIVRETTASTSTPSAGKTAPKMTRLASVYMIYRIGAADLTIQTNPASANPAHVKFDKYLLDSALNSNASLENKGKKPTTLKAAGARHVLVKSWAVTLGTAQFALIFQNDDSTTQEFSDALEFHGDLVMSQSPVPLKIAETGVKKSTQKKAAHNSNQEESTKYSQLFAEADGAELMANDGGGDLNLQLRFAGSPDEEERFSVTTEFEVTINPEDATALKHKATKTAAASSTSAVAPVIATPSAAALSTDQAPIAYVDPLSSKKAKAQAAAPTATVPSNQAAPAAAAVSQDPNTPVALPGPVPKTMPPSN